MRCLGVDLGTKRIGLALSEPEGSIVSPLKVIEARPSLEETARTILNVAREYDAGTVVIGLPLNMDGTEGPQAKLSKALADALRLVAEEASLRDGSSSKGTPPLEVCLHDERLTSHAADQLLADRKLTHKKKRARRDAVAAQVLLQSFLEGRGTRASAVFGRRVPPSS